MSTDTLKKRGGRLLWIYSNLKWAMQEDEEGCTIPACFTFSSRFPIINNSCKRMSDCCYFHCWTLHYPFKTKKRRSRWAWKWRGPINPWFHWFPLFLSFFFLSAPKQRDRRSSRREKVSLWMRMAKHRTARARCCMRNDRWGSWCSPARGRLGGHVAVTLEQVNRQNLKRPPELSNRSAYNLPLRRQRWCSDRFVVCFNEEKKYGVVFRCWCFFSSLKSFQLPNRSIHATAAAVFYTLACINTAFRCNESWVKGLFSLLSGG